MIQDFEKSEPTGNFLATDEAEETSIAGGCLCGAVAFKVEDRFVYVVCCHCKDCQKQTGSAFTLSGAVPVKNLTITKGTDKISSYEKTADTTLNFCSCCGSQLFALKPRRGCYHVRLGSLARLPTLPSTERMAHVFVDSKMNCHVIGNDEFTRFAGLPEVIPSVHTTHPVLLAPT